MVLPFIAQVQCQHTIKPWLADSSSHHHICTEKAAISDYANFTDSNNVPKYETSEGTLTTAQGHRKCMINMDLQDRDTQELIVNYLYNLKLSVNIFSTSKAMKSMNIWHHIKDGTLLDLQTDLVIRYTYKSNRLYWLKTFTPSSYGYSFPIISANLAY